MFDLMPALVALRAKLDPEQLHVANWTPADGNMRVSACAGTGKTTATTALAGSLVGRKLVTASKLYVMTFSNKAGRELRDRLQPLLTAVDYKAVHVGTYHSLALAALRAHDPQRWQMTLCLDVGGKTRASHIPSADVIWRAVVEWGTIPGTGEGSLRIQDVKGRDYKLAADVLRAEMHPVDSEAAHDVALAQFAEAWAMFDRAKTALGAWDFSDVLAEYHRMLVSGEINPGAEVVLVDEAQDCTRIMVSLGRALAANGRIVVVGDQRQSIHKWRGAWPELFENAERELEAHTREVTTNYRSGYEIVKLGNRITDGWAVPAKPFIKSPGQVRAIAINGVMEPNGDAAAFVADEIRSDVDSGANPGDYMILCRTNAALGVFQAALTEKQVPCVVVGSASLFDQREVETVLCYCILAQHDAYNSLERVLNQPKRFLPAKFAEACKQTHLLSPDVPMAEIIRRGAGALPAGSRRGAIALADLVTKLRRTPWADVPDAVVEVLTAKSTKVKKLLPGESPDEDRPALYKAAAAIARRFESAQALYDFAQRCAQNAAVITDGDDIPNRRVMLMTSHRSKGLEAPYVYIYANEGQYPHSKAPPNSADELRLFYVASTRGREKVTFVYCTPSEYVEKYVTTDGGQETRGVEADPDEFLLTKTET